MDQNYVKAYKARGKLYRDQNKLNESISDYSKVIESDPTDVDAYIARGNSYRDQKKFD